jgi:phenylpropionate dioxygenase-like ring-hydroxylating dioxygenase large terminal subunit
MTSSLLDMKIAPFAGSWFAVLAKSGCKGVDLPVSIEVAGEKLVAWRNPITSEWSVMMDVCPHRLAPLSQGRVDPISGCIECPYHGQQFDGTGACTKIPQSEKDAIPDRTSAMALPVHSTGDILWAFLPLSPGQASNYPTLPEIAVPELLDSQSIFTRDLPYSFDFLAENFMDPAHIPFAHHSLQGSRKDGSPIPMQVITSYDNATHLEVAYQDFVSGKTRDGVVSFTAPFYYHFRTRYAKTGITRKNLMAVLTPVSPGVSRIFLDLPALRKLRGLFPDWLSHSFTNKFLETDVWVHDQERTQRAGFNPYLQHESPTGELNGSSSPSSVGTKYVMTTQSDTGTRAWRKWWYQHMASSPIFGEPRTPVPWRSRESQLDRFENHAKYCSSCRGALANSNTLKKLVPFLAIAIATIAPTKVLKIVGLVASYFLNEAAEWVRRSILGYRRGEANSAAQFAGK